MTLFSLFRLITIHAKLSKIKCKLEIVNADSVGLGSISSVIIYNVVKRRPIDLRDLLHFKATTLAVLGTDQRTRLFRSSQKAMVTNLGIILGRRLLSLLTFFKNQPLSALHGHGQLQLTLTSA